MPKLEMERSTRSYIRRSTVYPPVNTAQQHFHQQLACHSVAKGWCAINNVLSTNCQLLLNRLESDEPVSDIWTAVRHPVIQDTSWRLHLCQFVRIECQPLDAMVDTLGSTWYRKTRLTCDREKLFLSRRLAASMMTLLGSSATCTVTQRQRKSMAREAMRETDKGHRR